MTRSKGPARNYSWPDATPGNYIALKHGARSERKIAERTQETLKEIQESGPAWLSEFPGEVRSLARAEAIGDLIFQGLEKYGILNENGDPKRLLQDWLKYNRRASEIRKGLGLTPQGRVQLEAARASAQIDSTLAAQVSIGRELRLAAEARQELTSGSEMPQAESDPASPSEAAEQIFSSQNSPPDVSTTPRYGETQIQNCPHGDETCPCRDGDLCHYEGQNPMPCPTSGIVGCNCR